MRHLRKLSTLLLLCSAFILTVVSTRGSDWPRFRGPNGSGVSPDTTPTPATWSPTENLAWKTELPGAGVSCPIVIGDRIFVTCYSGYGLDRRDPGNMADLKRHLVCVDRKSGEITWTKTVASTTPEDPYSGPGVPEHGYASHTPVSDGKNVYVYFGKSGAFAFDMEGHQLWQTTIGSDSDDRQWGSSSSPILFNDVMIVTAGPEARAIVGLSTTDGSELWRAPSDSLGSVWASPVLARVDNERTDVVIDALGEIWGLNPENGKLRWYCESANADQNSSSVVEEDGVVYALEGRGGGSIAVEAGGKGDITQTNVKWRGSDNARFASPIVYKGHLYNVGGNVVTCMDVANGEQVWQERLGPAGGAGGDGGGGGGRGGRGGFGGGDYASPVIADGKLYYVSRSGTIHVAQIDGGFEYIAGNRVTEDSEDFSATPAIVDGQIFIRSSRHLYCVAAQ